MSFKFYKLASASIKGTWLLHSQACFNSMWSMFDLSSSRSRAWCRMNLKFSTCESNGLMTKTVYGISFILFLVFFLNFKTFVKGLWKKLNKYFSSVFLGNRWKEKKAWYHFVEILVKVMDPLKIMVVKKTNKTWNSRKVTFSYIFTIFLAKEKQAKIAF